MKNISKIATLVGSLLLAMMFVNTATADSNPFAQSAQLQAIDGGGDSKCGDKKDMKDGKKCGDKKDMKDGKKCGDKKDMKDGKKCGDKKDGKKCGDKKEKKCGESKCGGK